MMIWRNDTTQVMIFGDSINCKGFGRYSVYTGDNFTRSEFCNKNIQTLLVKYIGKKTLLKVHEAIKKRKKGIWHSNGYSIEYSPAELTIGTIDRYGGTGSSVTLEAFLEGEFQTNISASFGVKIFEQIICTAKAVIRAEETGAELPQVPTYDAPVKTDDNPAAEGTLQKLVSWDYGMNWEYHYSAWIYSNVIVWKLEMDEQWGGAVTEYIQTIEDFSVFGVPDESGHRDSIPETELKEIEEFIKSGRTTKPY